MTTPTTPPLSKIRTGGNLVFLSGELPFNADGSVPEGIEAQTALTIDRIEATLKAQGLELGDVISMTAYLTNAADFAGGIRREIIMQNKFSILGFEGAFYQQLI